MCVDATWIFFCASFFLISFQRSLVFHNDFRVVVFWGSAAQRAHLPAHSEAQKSTGFQRCASVELIFFWGSKSIGKIFPRQKYEDEDDEIGGFLRQCMARAMAAAGVAKEEAKRCETLNVSPEGTDLTQGSWHRFHRRWCPRRRLLHMPKNGWPFLNGAPLVFHYFNMQSLVGIHVCRLEWQGLPLLRLLSGLCTLGWW